MNTTTTVVILVMNPDVPELPNSVWLAPLPKAAPISEPRPVCKRTISTSAIAEVCVIWQLRHYHLHLSATVCYYTDKAIRFQGCSAYKTTIYIFHCASGQPIFSGVTLPP